MTNDSVLALIEELCDMPDRYLNGRARELANALKYEALPQRDQAVAETVERCAEKAEIYASHVTDPLTLEGRSQTITATLIASSIRDISPDPLFRQRIENAARLEEANWWKHRTVTWGLDKAISI